MSQFSRVNVTVMELDIDHCSLTYGSAPCTASGSPGAECYNTYRTCQDRANYSRTTKTYRFCDRGAPVPVGETIRPYLSNVKFAPTEIDPDAGIAKRATVTITVADEPDADVDTDPYLLNRATPPAGTFWSRFFARNHNYSGRVARIRRAYLTAGWDWGQFVDELYIIDNIKGPSARDEITITLKDPLKLTDRSKVPAPTGGKLAYPMTASDFRAVLTLGDGAQYDDSGYVRIGEEVINYTRREVENGWNFNDNDLEGWTADNASLASGTDSLTITATAANPAMRAAASIYGYRFRYIIARLRRTVAGTWRGRCYYTTSTHGETTGYYKDITEPAGIGSGFVYAVWDMHTLTAGGNDWQINTITGLRLDLDADNASAYELDWIGWSESNALDRNVLTWPDGTYRAQFGTLSAAAKANDGVQQCLAYIDQPFSTVAQDLMNQSGLLNANIDVAGMQQEDTDWLGARYHVTACLTEPEDVSVYLAELAIQSGGVFWWSPTAQKVKYKFIGPTSPGAVTDKTLTDEANIIDGSVRIESLDQLRKTFVAINYELYRATANRKEAKNYTRGEIYIDAGAESDNEYGDRRVDVHYSRWFNSNNSQAMNTWAKRRVGMYRDVPLKIECRADPKDAAITEGDLYDVTTDVLTDARGAAENVRCLVLKRQDNAGDISVLLRTTNFGRRYGFIAPNGTPNYPNNNGYACASNNAGAMNDGTEGYRII